MNVATREQLEDWVERWLKANRDAEAAGDWNTASITSQFFF